MDVKGISLSLLSGDVLTYLKAASEINSKHYPLSQKKLFIVNAPFWFSGAWGGIKNVLPASVRDNTSISSGSYLPALLKDIDRQEIPKEYGGDHHLSLGESEAERGERAKLISIFAVRASSKLTTFSFNLAHSHSVQRCES